MIVGLLALGSLAALAATWALAAAWRRSRWRVLGWACLACAGPCLLGFWALLAATAWQAWFLYRPQPRPESRVLFQGVSYWREVQRRPWPMIVHVVKVDLRAPGVGLAVTPGDPYRGREFRAQATSDFLKSAGVQVAINGGFFYPGHYNGLWDYYPHAGDPVDALGFFASAGRRASARTPGYRTLVFSRDNQPRVADRVTSGYNAISGMGLALGGKPGEDRAAAPLPALAKDREPRTAVALDATGRALILVVIDGRQPNYSEGATLAELADVVRRHGGAVAINLDGGGSSTLVVEAGHGRARLLNMPIHANIPGLERPVANNLGIFARPAQPSGPSARQGATRRAP